MIRSFTTPANNGGPLSATLPKQPKPFVVVAVAFSTAVGGPDNIIPNLQWTYGGVSLVALIPSPVIGTATSCYVTFALDIENVDSDAGGANHRTATRIPPIVCNDQIQVLIESGSGNVNDANSEIHWLIDDEPGKR